MTEEVQITDSDDPTCKPNIVCRTYPEGMLRTDTTSDKVFFVGRAAATPPTPPTPPAKPSMGDAF